MTGESADDGAEASSDGRGGPTGAAREAAADLDVVLVVAVADNGVIGVDGEIPWHLPEDLAHFKRTTVGHPVVMGRRTYESIADFLGGPLPDRPNLVLTTRDIDLPAGATVVDSIEEALRQAHARDDTLYVVGGSVVYEQFLPLADRLVYTEVHRRPEGDTHFPDWDRSEWREAERDDREDLSFVTFERVETPD